jgi:GT2 family glycosyltransferase
MGSVHPILVSRLIAWGQQFKVSFYFTFKVTPHDRARNQIVEFFLSGKSADGAAFTHLLMIDSDTIPPIDAVERLLSHERPVITGLTPILSYDEEGGFETYDNAFVRVVNGDNEFVKTLIPKRNTGVHEVLRCGASCILIGREVFERIDRPYFRFVTNEENTQHVRSEDVDFCDRARAAGFTIFADTDVVCQHYKDIML